MCLELLELRKYNRQFRAFVFLCFRIRYPSKIRLADASPILYLYLDVFCEVNKPINIYKIKSDWSLFGVKNDHSKVKWKIIKSWRLRKSVFLKYLVNHRFYINFGHYEVWFLNLPKSFQISINICLFYFYQPAPMRFLYRFHSHIQSQGSLPTFTKLSSEGMQRHLLLLYVF